MRRLAFSVGIALCVTTASAATVDYTFALRLSPDFMFLEPEHLDAAGPPYVAWTGSFVYDVAFEFGFSYDGDLAGLTLDLANLSASVSDSWHNARDWGSPEGFVTLGADGPVEWDFQDAEESWGHAYRHKSDGGFEGRDWWVSNTVNPEAVAMSHYGSFYSEPDFWMFALAPGQWTCLADGLPCVPLVAEAPLAHAPIPASLPLLLGGVASMLWIARRRARPAAPARFT